MMNSVDFTFSRSKKSFKFNRCIPIATFTKSSKKCTKILWSVKSKKRFWKCEFVCVFIGAKHTLMAMLYLLVNVNAYLFHQEENTIEANHTSTKSIWMSRISHKWFGVHFIQFVYTKIARYPIDRLCWWVTISSIIWYRCCWFACTVYVLHTLKR